MPVRSIKIVSVLTFSSLCLGLAACNSTGINAGLEQTKETTDAIAAMVTAKTGDAYQVVKIDSDHYGYFVLQDTTTGEYLALNVTKYSKGMTYDQLAAATVGQDPLVVHNLQKGQYDNTSWNPTQSYEPYSGTYTGGWNDIHETIYTGGGYVFEDVTPQQKDLETIGAVLSATSRNQIRDLMVRQYGLSESRANDLASLVSSWSDLSKKREMTTADLKDFSTAALGTDFSSIQKAYQKSQQQGDSSDWNNLVKTAAQTNGISVEHARAILKTFMN